MGKLKKGGASERLVAWAVGLSRPAKRLVMLVADGIMIPLALATAVWLKNGSPSAGTLPNQSKLVLYSIFILDKQNKKAGNTQALTTGVVYDVYRELCNKMRYNCLTQRRTADLISELDMLGVITARVISKGRHGRTTEIQMSSSSSSKDLLAVLQEDDMFKELANYKMKGQARLTV